MSKKYSTIKYLLLCAAPLLLYGCQSWPFRLGESLSTEDLIEKQTSKEKKVEAANAKSDAAKPAEKQIVTRTVEKKIDYKVQDGDTLYSLARKNNIKVADLAASNDLKITDQLKVGQNIVIPKKVTVTGPTEGDDSITPVKKPDAVTQTELPNNDDDSAKPGTFVWPANPTTVLQKFGDGDSPDGLLLSGVEGQNILAANGGTVIYVGTDIKPLGLLVLVKHAGGFVSTYGHLQRALIKKGDTIKKGQAIATLGRSGTASRPQLYFEIRKNNHPVNPSNFLSQKK